MTTAPSEQARLRVPVRQGIMFGGAAGLSFGVGLCLVLNGDFLLGLMNILVGAGSALQAIGFYMEAVYDLDE